MYIQQIINLKFLTFTLSFTDSSFGCTEGAFTGWVLRGWCIPGWGGYP